jgi:hypothetical protein
VILEPDTPGGFRFSMAWRPASRSATTDAMVPRVGDTAAEIQAVRGMPDYGNG